MKKIYLLFSLLAFTLLLTGQTLLTEDFSAGVMPPDGWSIDDHAANWSTETSENAGGTAPEAKFNWDPDFIGDSRFISPV